MSLNRLLGKLGYETRKPVMTLSRRPGVRDVVRDGVVVFSGTAQEVWDWLHDKALKSLWEVMK